jgi:c-di-GMP-related signal transduction protein
VDYAHLETLIRREMSLSYKLLRYVNSVAFYPRTEIHSIKQALDLFLMGLFSLLDAIVDRPLEDLLNQLALAADVRETLLGKPLLRNAITSAYELVLAYEKAEWEEFAPAAARLGVPQEAIPGVYLDAINWSEQIFRG